MTKSEICLKLAERLEPNPEHEPDGTGLSVGGFWDSFFGQSNKHTEGHWLEWFPSDFFTNESANARLLESMGAPNNGICVFAICQEWEVIKPFCWTTKDQGTTRGCEGAALARHRDRKTAVILAACAWLGIEVGGIE